LKGRVGFTHEPVIGYVEPIRSTQAGIVALPEQVGSTTRKHKKNGIAKAMPKQAVDLPGGSVTPKI
jgi:hypothetical protein